MLKSLLLMAEVGVEESLQSCVTEVNQAIEQGKTRDTDSVLVIVGSWGNRLPYNRKLIKPPIAQRSPFGFYFHTTLCQADTAGLPKKIVDPSMKKPTPLTTEEYLTKMFGQKNKEISLDYYVIPLDKFQRHINQVGLNSFDPYTLVKEYPRHLTVI